MDTRTESGDVYELTPNCILVYGSGGIELRLTQRNLDTLRNAAKSSDVQKDSDGKDRKFSVIYESTMDQFIIEPNKGEVVRVPTWMILPELCMKRAA